MRSGLLAFSFALSGCSFVLYERVGQVAYSANPEIGQCVATCARPGSIMVPRICHSTCKDTDGNLFYLAPSTPGAAAVLSNIAGPFSDLVERLAPVVPIVP